MKTILKNVFTYVTSWLKLIEEKIGRGAMIAIFGAFLLLIGFIMYQNRPRYLYKETGEVETGEISKADATSIIDSALDHILKIYENPGEIFKGEEMPASKVNEEIDDSALDTEDGEAVVINTNYDEENIDKFFVEDYSKIKNFFTEKGIKEFENATFGGKKYVSKEKDEDGKIISVIFNTGLVEKENKFTGDVYSISKLVIDEEEITCKINFSRLSIGSNDDVNYAVYSKNMKLVKSGDNWLVDSFIYTINK